MAPREQSFQKESWALSLKSSPRDSQLPASGFGGFGCAWKPLGQAPVIESWPQSAAERGEKSAALSVWSPSAAS